MDRTFAAARVYIRKREYMWLSPAAGYVLPSRSLIESALSFFILFYSFFLCFFRTGERKREGYRRSKECAQGERKCPFEMPGQPTRQRKLSGEECELELTND